jgi:hypothetical protein
MDKKYLNKIIKGNCIAEGIKERAEDKCFKQYK